MYHVKRIDKPEDDVIKEQSYGHDITLLKNNKQKNN